jgi:hypothetical protein
MWNLILECLSWDLRGDSSLSPLGCIVFRMINRDSNFNRPQAVPIDAQKKAGIPAGRSLAREKMLTQSLHQFIDRPVQVFIRPPLLIDL